jgi:hypothetical protein
VRFLLVLLPLLATTALAEDENAFAPFGVNASLTTGDVSGFRQLFLEADGLAEKLSPENARTGEPKGELVIENTSTAFAKITVGDVLVGILGPLTTGRIQGASAGSYKVQVELPNGYTKTVVVGTPAVVAPAAPDAEDEAQ